MMRKKMCLVPAESTGEDPPMVAGGLEKEQFSFEDGTPLLDYPATVDLELTGRDGELRKANIMGYTDIYSSHILLNEPHAGEPTPLGSSSLEPHGSGRQLKRSFPEADVVSINSERFPAQPIPVVVVEQPQVPSPSPPLPQPVAIPPPSPNLREVEEFLNQSLTDLLQMTQAMAEEAGLEDDTA